MSIAPHLNLEQSFWDAGSLLVCGMDEVGRGAWVGSVAIGAVVLTKRTLPAEGPITQVRDSKMLSAKKRLELLPHVKSWVAAYAVGEATSKEIDQFGMTASLRLAGERALEELETKGFIPDRILLDGPHDYLKQPERVTTLVKGDSISLAIAAASIIAKVHRDKQMQTLAQVHPGYAFERNAGYGSPAHKAALADLGAIEEHRHSWSFMRALNEEQLSFNLEN